MGRPSRDRAWLFQSYAQKMSVATRHASRVLRSTLTRSVPHSGTHHGREELASVSTRATTFVGELAVARGDETIAIVAHDSINRLILLSALQLPLAESLTPAEIRGVEAPFPQKSAVTRSLARRASG